MIEQTKMSRSELEVLILETAAMVNPNSKPMSDHSLSRFMHHLSALSDAQILGALERVERECNFFNLKEFMDRVDDGRPGAEEAFSMIPFDENSTVVWTIEMREAHAVAYPLMDGGKNIHARVAFIEKYKTLVVKARADGAPVKWVASLGSDQADRERALTIGVQNNLLTRDYAKGLLPSITFKVNDEGRKLLAQIPEITNMSKEEWERSQSEKRKIEREAEREGFVDVAKFQEVLEEYGLSKPKREPYPENLPARKQPTDEEIRLVSGLTEEEYLEKQKLFTASKNISKGNLEAVQ